MGNFTRRMGLGVVVVLLLGAVDAAASPVELPASGLTVDLDAGWSLHRAEGGDVLEKDGVAMFVRVVPGTRCQEDSRMRGEAVELYCPAGFTCVAGMRGDISGRELCADTPNGKLRVFFAATADDRLPAGIPVIEALLAAALRESQTVRMLLSGIDVTMPGPRTWRTEVSEGRDLVGVSPDEVIAFQRGGDCPPERRVREGEGWAPAITALATKTEGKLTMCATINGQLWRFVIMHPQQSASTLEAWAKPAVVAIIDALEVRAAVVERSRRRGTGNVVPLGRFFLAAGRLMPDAELDALTEVRVGVNLFLAQEGGRFSIAYGAGLAAGSDGDAHLVFDAFIAAGISWPTHPISLLTLAVADADRTGPDGERTHGLQGHFGGLAVARLPLGSTALDLGGMFATKQRRGHAAFVLGNGLSVGAEWQGDPQSDVYLVTFGGTPPPAR